MENNVGFEKDGIFLLSVEEYYEYKDRIPQVRTSWWLRSPGYYQNIVAFISSDGSVGVSGLDVHYAYGVRPCKKISDDMTIFIGQRITYCGFPFIVIDKHLAIVEVPIAFKAFDKNSNDHGASEVRKFLLDWRKERI